MGARLAVEVVGPNVPAAPTAILTVILTSSQSASVGVVCCQDSDREIRETRETREGMSLGMLEVEHVQSMEGLPIAPSLAGQMIPAFTPQKAVIYPSNAGVRTILYL